MIVIIVYFDRIMAFSLSSIFLKHTRLRLHFAIGVEFLLVDAFKFYYEVSLAHLLLRHTDNLSRTLQHKNISAAAGQQVAKSVVKTLQGLQYKITQTPALNFPEQY